MDRRDWLLVGWGALLAFIVYAAIKGGQQSARLEAAMSRPMDQTEREIDAYRHR